MKDLSSLNKGMSTWGTGLTERDVVVENRFGRMGPVTKGTGSITWHQALAGSFIPMETITKDNGNRIELKVSVNYL